MHIIVLVILYIICCIRCVRVSSWMLSSHRNFHCNSLTTYIRDANLCSHMKRTIQSSKAGCMHPYSIYTDSHVWNAGLQIQQTKSKRKKVSRSPRSSVLQFFVCLCYRGNVHFSPVQSTHNVNRWRFQSIFPPFVPGVRVHRKVNQSNATLDSSHPSRPPSHPPRPTLSFPIFSMVHTLSICSIYSPFFDSRLLRVYIFFELYQPPATACNSMLFTSLNA